MLMSELSHAIERNELVLHYQPKISLIGQDDVCLEALVRWQHPIRGLLPPARFIELAEMTDVIRLLTLWVMEEAARQCRQWRKAGYPVNVAVNISVRNLRDAGLPNEIANIVKQYGIKPAWLEFEITESAIMDIKSSLEILQRISSMGHLLSIDDFGAGYSTLAYLSRLPVQNLKIDRWFVQQMNNSPRDAGVVQATIGLAHNLGMRVIAEGVENGETLERLRNLGCDQAQGYFISKPKPAEEIETWMDAQGLCAAV
jgi:EAL domain-containing protein (putative c-di-GMP-specific phosphodiesterase class I)